MTTLKRLLEYEKAQVFIVAVVLMSLVYWPMSGILKPDSDPVFPTVFFVSGNYIAFIALALILAAFSLIASLFTVQSRPEGTFAAILLGLAGFSFRSGPAETVLEMESVSGFGLYSLMALEIILMFVMMAGVEELVSLFRRSASAVLPDSGEVLLYDRLTDEHRRKLEQEEFAVPARSSIGGLFVSVRDFLLVRADKKKDTPAAATTTNARCFGVGFVLGMVLTSIFMRTADRGQILFSIFAGYTIASIVANRYYPSSRICVLWSMPLAGAAVFYTFASFGDRSIDSAYIASMSAIYKTLPLDWLTAGCGGSLLGAWINRRMRDMRMLELLEQENKAQS